MSARWFHSVLLLALVAAGCSRENPAYETSQPDESRVAGEVIVRFAGGPEAAEIAARIEPWGGVVLSDLSGDPENPAAINWLNGTFRLGLPDDLSIDEAIALLEQEADLEYAEPNYIMRAIKAPNDPDYARLWGMPKISAPTAWDTTTGSMNVVVGIIDTGVDYNHPDLVDNMWVNEGEIPGNGIDDDGNGFVDDVHGYDFCNMDGDPMDDHYHGTHVAGTVAGRGDNGIGVAGVAWRSRIMALKFLCASGSGSGFAAALAIRYAVDNGAHLTNNSWGYQGGPSQTVGAAIQYALEADQLFVAAAGNNGTNNDQLTFYPASFDHPNVVTVAASDGNDNRASFSNYGKVRVDIAAPGTWIYSASPGGGYRSLQGTSMAAPHVAGALAVLYARVPNISSAVAKKTLLDNVDPVAGWQQLVSSGGRLNVARMLGAVLMPPPAPTGVQVGPDGPDSVSLNWDPSADPETTQHRIYVRSAAGATWPAIPIDGPATVTTVVRGLGEGSWYFSLSAVSPGGESDRSAEVRFDFIDETPPAQILDLSVFSAPGSRRPVDTVGATSVFGPSWAAEQLLDGNPFTGWAAVPADAPIEQRLLFDLGTPQSISQVALRATVGFEGLYPPGFEIRVAKDLGDWLVVARELSAAAPQNEGWARFDFAPIDARYVELRVTEPAVHPSGLRYAALGDLEIYGPPVEPGAIVLSWTAPGDDAGRGQATAYDLRIAPNLQQSNFETAPAFAIDPPAPAGLRQFVVINGLGGDSSYGVGLRAIDDGGRAGAVSPIVTVTTGALPPGGIEDLAATAVGGGRVQLSWTAPADDGLTATSGAVADYEVRYSEQPITGASWPDAQPVSPAFVIAAPGTEQTVELDLPTAPRLYFRVAAVDDAGLRGPWSNGADVDAGGTDLVAPARIDDLVAVLASDAFERAPAFPIQDTYLDLTDGDLATGWMAEATPGSTRTIVFETGAAVPLARVRIRPHMNYPGDFPGTVTVRAADPVTGVVATLAEHTGAVAPGDWITLDFTPVQTTGFELVLADPSERFGLAVYAMGEVETYEARPGAEAARLTWIAPGDDGYAGRAQRYELRATPTPIDSLAAFDSTPPPADTLAAPQDGGALEVAFVGSAAEGQSRYYSVRACDEAGNCGEPSNPGRVVAPPIPPAPVADLRVVERGANRLLVAFTATGEDGTAGQATEYELRFTDGELNVWTFAAAARVATDPPLPAGADERYEIAGLGSNTQYQIAVVVFDAEGSQSGLSNVAIADTLDATPPSVIQDLAVTVGADDRVSLAFTAPGGDLDVGHASGYEARYALEPITPATFASATLLDLGATAPLPAGTSESRPAGPVPLESTLYFAIRAFDSQDNRAEIGNVVEYISPAVAPAPVDDLIIADRGADSLTLVFTASGDDGRVGQAAAYALRYAAAPILTDADWAAAQVAGTPAPKAAGQTERIVVGGLASATRYHFAIAVSDETGATSARSASVDGITLDITPPTTVADLRAVALPGVQSLSSRGASASSTFGAQTEAFGLTDANPASVWISEATDTPQAQWVQLDLGAPQPVGRLRLRAADGYTHLFPKDYVVSGSLDGDTWSPLVSEQGVVAVNTDWRDRSFAFAEVRYLRLTAAEGQPQGDRFLVAVGGFEAFAVAPGAMTGQLSWTAPADQTGVTQYELRMSTTAFDAASFGGAQIIAAPQPAQAGFPEAHTVSGLQADTTYWFALVSVDADGNRSAVSNITQVLTLGVPPATITDLRAEDATLNGLTVAWTAPGADGQQGQAATYDLRISRGPLNEDTWADAVRYQAPAPQSAGAIERFTADGLLPSITYNVAVRAIDADGNEGGLSNVATVRTLDPVEQIPPSAVADLAAVTDALRDDAIELSWTAPGDDGDLGVATSYELRWSLQPITPQTFAQATPADAPVPTPSGTRQSVSVVGLPIESEVFFALRATDEVGNVGAISNIASASTKAIPPARIEDLRATVAGGGVTFEWTAPGDNFNLGQAAQYQLYMAQSPIGEQPAFAPLDGVVAPSPAGTPESHSVAGLLPDSQWHVAVRAIDANGNVGAMSPSVPFGLLDEMAPGPFTQLAAMTGAQAGAVELSFVSPGDDGDSGTADRYEARWATAPFAPDTFAQAQPYDGPLPVVAGNTQGQLTFTGLTDETEIWVALRAIDNAGNVGPVSAVVSARTLDVAPGRIVDVVAVADGPSRVVLGWTATGDDGALGQAAQYEVRQHSAPINDSNWQVATPVAQALQPVPAGLAEQLMVDGLSAGTEYHFAVVAIDERGNRGVVSNSAAAGTSDVDAPGPVGDLLAEGQPDGTVLLTWTAAGDDGIAGTAASVEIRVAQQWIGFEQATLADAQTSLVEGGRQQTAVVRGLSPESVYGFALVTQDEAGNTSAPSNVAEARTAGVPPGAIAELLLRPAAPGTLELSFIAPADNGVDAASGPVAGYEIVVSDAVFVAGQFDSLPMGPGPQPVAPGGQQVFVIENLAADQPYWVAVRAFDADGNRGEVTVVAEGRTADTTAPEAVVSLEAEGPQVGGDALEVAAVDASSTVSAEWAAGNVVDQDIDSAWASSPEAAPWLALTLANPTSIGAVRLHVGQWVERFPVAFAVEVDGVVVTQVDGLQAEANKWVEVSFAPVRGEQVRLVVQSVGGDGSFVVIDELEILPGAAAPNSVLLTWLAPGDDGRQGQAARYEIRRSTAPLDPANFGEATPVATEVPAPAGTPESLRIEDLEEQTQYFFALVTEDEAGNRSGLSNIAQATTGGIAPAPIGDLVAQAMGATEVKLSWTAPGGSGDVGQAASYEIRYRPASLSALSWSTATPVDAPVPEAAGTAQTAAVIGLLPGTQYAFAIKSVDELGNVSHLSVVARTVTDAAEDVFPPAAVRQLRVRAAAGNGQPLAIGEVVASGSQFPDFPQSAAVDGDSATAWASPARAAAGEESLTLSLAAPVALSGLRLEPDAAQFELFPMDFVVEVSVDGLTWQEVHSEQGYISQPGRALELDFAPTVAVMARLRAQRIFRAPHWLLAVGEFAVFEAAEPGTVSVTFIAPGDDGLVGTAASFEVAHSNGPIDETNWDTAEPLDVGLVPMPADAPMGFTVSGLGAGMHHFAVRAIDENGNLGAVQPSASVRMP